MFRDKLRLVANETVNCWIPVPVPQELTDLCGATEEDAQLLAAGICRMDPEEASKEAPNLEMLMLGRICLRLRFIDGQSWLRFEELCYHFRTVAEVWDNHGTSTSATRCRMAGSLSKSGELIGSSNERIEYNRLIGSREKNLGPFGRLCRHVTPLFGDCKVSGAYEASLSLRG